MSTHEAFMREAISLSRHGYPFYAHVGCVIVKDGEIVGRGFHDYTGGPHAEVVALRDAGEKARGATAYVTLEPCNHFGKTPPCTDALLEYRVKRVVMAGRDPNPRAAGGLEKLREHGVEVIEGVCAREAAEANLQFLFAIAHQRPMVTVKAGVSLDGKVATATGESQWITNESSRRDAMELRAKIGAVLVGRKTAEHDRARLNVRGIEVVHQPLRVVIDPSESLSLDLPIFDDSAPTYRATKFESLADILQQIRAEGRTGVMIEGGPTTVGNFLEEGLVDHIVLYVSPKVLGAGPSWSGGFQVQNLGLAPQFELVKTETIDGDLKLLFRSRNLVSFLASYSM